LPLRATFGDPTDLARRPVLTQCHGLWVFDRLWVVPVSDYCG
jgi:hypothetical protein